MVTEARRQNQRLHSRAHEEKTALPMRKIQTTAGQRAGAGAEGHVALGTRRTCASYMPHPPQPVTARAKPLITERGHTPTSGLPLGEGQVSDVPSNTD